MSRKFFALTVFLSSISWGTAPAPSVNDIVQRSVANTHADWKEAPQYSFREHDIISKSGRRTDKTYEVMMIDGSPYEKLIAVNGRPLSPSGAAAEEQKMQREIQRRRNETPRARQKRVAEYQKERRQDQALLREMVNAFNFKLIGEDTVNGRRCYVLAAAPRPGYQPKSRETKVLTGMRGKMWVDAEQYQWVRIHAEVFQPVAFGLFIAHVEPGTQFVLENKPVQANLWLPSHFSVRVKANVLLFFSRNSTDDETYADYRRAPAATTALR